MTRFFSLFLTLLLLLALIACSSGPEESIVAATESMAAVIETVPPTTSAKPIIQETKPTLPTPTESQPPATVPVETTIVTEPLHSEFYIDGFDVEEVIVYFNEVCLSAEFVNSGDPSRLQKWDSPIYYRLYGNYTEEDYETLTNFTEVLNSIFGFPGIYEIQDPFIDNLSIYFCTQKEMVARLGENFRYMDGGVTFWYTDDVINTGIICYRTELDQYLRNSVILEEIYNGLGPIQDTKLREDSIIYEEFSLPQMISEMDFLLLQLLYHPLMLPGMDAEECEAVIRSLYY